MSGETLTCSSQFHNHSGSKYEKHKVPIELFINNKQKSFFKSCSYCRDYDQNKKKKHKSTEIKFELDANTNQCKSSYHASLGSIYPKNKVPLLEFENVKNKDLPFKACSICRNHKRSMEHKNKLKKDLLSKQRKLDNPEFQYCSHSYHNYEGVSVYPRHKVPINLFSDVDGTLYINCQDCRTYEQNNLSIIYSPKYRQKYRDYIKMLKDERIDKYGCCCCICECILLYNEKTQSINVYNTYLIDDQRYVNIDNIIYLSNDAIQCFKSQIEYTILEFDHLTEQEQRQKGLLLDNEEYIGKINIVSHMSSFASIKSESLKCQLICSKCHLIETIKREKHIIPRTELTKKKINYITPLKLKGCLNCGFNDSNLLRFFEFDHLDPITKLDHISNMVYKIDFTYEEFVKEVSKCRVLCRWCHALHSLKQRKKSDD